MLFARCCELIANYAIRQKNGFSTFVQKQMLMKSTPVVCAFSRFFVRLRDNYFNHTHIKTSEKFIEYRRVISAVFLNRCATES